MLKDLCVIFHFFRPNTVKTKFVGKFENVTLKHRTRVVDRFCTFETTRDFVTQKLWDVSGVQKYRAWKNPLTLDFSYVDRN